MHGGGHAWQGGVHGRGHAWRGVVCVAGGGVWWGCAWQGGMCGGGHAWWWGAYMVVGGMHGRGMHGGGECMTGGMHGRGHTCHAHHPLTLRDTVGQCAGGTHPTGMHSCHLFIQPKMRVCCGISIVLPETSLYCPFRDMLHEKFGK